MGTILAFSQGTDEGSSFRSGTGRLREHHGRGLIIPDLSGDRDMTESAELIPPPRFNRDAEVTLTMKPNARLSEN
jgi:hypothetical protein